MHRAPQGMSSRKISCSCLKQWVYAPGSIYPSCWPPAKRCIRVCRKNPSLAWWPRLDCRRDGKPDGKPEAGHVLGDLAGSTPMEPTGGFEIARSATAAGGTARLQLVSSFPGSGPSRFAVLLHFPCECV